MYSESLELLARFCLLTGNNQTPSVLAIRDHEFVYYLFRHGRHYRAKELSMEAIQTGKNLKRDSLMSLIYANYCRANPSLSDDSVRYYLANHGKLPLGIKTSEC